MTTEIQDLSKVIFFNPELEQDVVNSFESVHEVVTEICFRIYEIKNQLELVKGDYDKERVLDEQLSYLDNLRNQLIG